MIPKENKIRPPTKYIEDINDTHPAAKFIPSSFVNDMINIPKNDIDAESTPTKAIRSNKTVELFINNLLETLTIFIKP